MIGIRSLRFGAGYTCPHEALEIAKEYRRQMVALVQTWLLVALIVLTTMISAGAQTHVWAWGKNNQGQLGDGTTTNRSTPVTVSGLTDVIALASGGFYHNLALRSDCTVWAWGDNTYGQLGTGTNISSRVPIQIAGLSGIVDVTAGSVFSLALRSDGSVWAWGSNRYGQLGNGNNIDRTVPVQVSGLSNIVKVAGGQFHGLALGADGRIWSWGANQKGQLGNGTTSDRNLPVQVTGLNGVVSIAAGYAHCLAVKYDGTIWSWGENGNRALGHGSLDSSVPVQVTNLTGATSVACGAYHSLALKSNGTVWAWGYNYDGELGDGTITVQKDVPVQVVGLNSVTQIAGGYMHSLAVRSDGTLWTWGQNTYGSLGNGTTSDSSVPVPVTNLSDVVAVAGGFDHSLAIQGVPARSRIAFSRAIGLVQKLFVMNEDGTGLTQVTTNTANDLLPSWSPIGSKIAFTSDRNGNTEIYTMNPDGTNQTRLTFGSVSSHFATWSPDGSKILFSRIVGEKYQIFVMNADGSGQSRLTTSSGDDISADWSPNGSKVVFASTRSGAYEIYTMNPDGTGVTQLTSTGAVSNYPVWSPDGTKIAFNSNRTTSFEIYVMNADGSNPVPLTNILSLDLKPTWSLDGSKIAFMSDRNGNTQIFSMNSDGSNPIALTPNTTEGANYPSWGGRRQAPHIDSTDPSDIVVPSSNQTVLVNGQGFVAGSKVFFNGIERVTDMIDSTKVMFTIPTSELQSGDVLRPLNVRNPDGQVSNAVSIHLTNAGALSNLSISPASVTGGTSTTGTVTLSSPALKDVDLALASANAAAQVPASVRVPAGATTASFAISTVAVTANKTFNITATLFGVAISKPMTVKAAVLSALSLAPTSVTGGSSATGTVKFTGPVAVDTTVSLASLNLKAHVPVPPTVVVPAGSSSATFQVSTSPMFPQELAVTGAISASFGGKTVTKNLTVKPPVLLSLTLSPSSIKGGDPRKVTGTITLSGPVPDFVVFSLTNTNAKAILSTASIAMLGPTATFTLTTQATSTTVRGVVTASNVAFGSKGATLTVTP